MIYKIPETGYINKKGYHVTCIKGVDFQTHRLIVEHFIKRKLTKQECVHHIDGNKLNNDINNLIIVSRKDHPSLHKHPINKPKLCRKCNQILSPDRFSIERGMLRSYCKKCRADYQRQYTRHSKIK